MPKNKKLVFILYSAFTGKPGGRENWIKNVSSCLDNPVEVICYQDQDQQEESVKNVRVARVRTLRSVIPNFNILTKASLGILLVLDMVWFVVKTFRHVERYQEDYGNDTVFIAMNSVIEGYAALLIKKTLRKKIVVSVRGKSPLELSSTIPYLRPLVYWIEKKVFRAADGIWANGFDTADYVKKISGRDPRVIPNGVDFASFSQAGKKKKKHSEEVTIMSVATLRAIKGIPQLVNSIPKIKKITSKKFNVVFAGFGNPQKYIRYLKKQGCEKYTDFIGPVPNIDVIGDADIVACLSGGSGMSMSAIEAMAAGKAIIAWDSPIYRQILKNKKSALLVSEGNVDDLSKGIVNLINNPKLRRRLGEEAQKEAQDYDWSKVCEVIRRESIIVN